jgi:predicted SAM-dependent methyltransferase
MQRLVIGAGERRVKGAKHHDIQPFEGIDYVCDFKELPKHVEAESFDEIYMTHFLEHFPIAETDEVLQIVRSLLKMGGRLYIEVPNFKWHALMILKDPLDEQIVEYAYGGQLNEWDFHYTGFTPELLRKYLEFNDFKIDGLDPNSSIECWSIKVEPDDEF